MGNLLKFFLRGFEDDSRAQAMAFERARAAALGDEPRVTSAEIEAALRGTDPVAMYEREDGTPLLVDRSIRRHHSGVFGGTGGGKSYGITVQLLAVIDDAIASLRARPEQDDERLPVQLQVIDVKSETVELLKLALADRYMRATPRIRRAIARSVHAIEWRHDAVTPVPLLSPSGDISPEYEAEVKTDILVRTSRQEWPESVRVTLFQILRVCKALGDQPHPLVIQELLHDASARKAAAAKVETPDLRDFLLRLEKLLRPQTIEALERRIQFEFAYPQIYLSSFLPHRDIVRLGVPTEAPITLVDCGSKDLPPSIGMARANLLATDFFFSAMRRNPATPLTIFLEEFLLLLSYNPHLLSRVLDALRILRSTNTSIVFAAQSLDGIPKASVRELLTNIGAITAFQSRSDVADVLAPYVLSGHATAKRDRERFERDLATLKPREAYFWVKSAGGALRVRSQFLPDAVATSGVPKKELRDLFDREITPRSRIAVRDARALIEKWEAERFRPERAAPATQPARPATDVRSFLGLDGDNDV